jgi:hypothetical protein
VRRHLKVVRGRLALVDAAGEVEGGTVAGTQETARPVGGHAVSAAGLELGRRRAAEVGTDADGDQDLGLDRARLVLAILRLHVLVGLRIGHRVIELGQRFEHVLAAVDDPHRLAAPLDGHHLTGLELADIDFNRRAGCLGPLGRQHAGQERHERSQRPRPADGSSRDDKSPPSAVHFALIAHSADP